MWSAMPRPRDRNWFSRAGARQEPDCAGYSANERPISYRIAPLAPVAQWIERPPPKGQVGRSIRLRGTNKTKRYANFASGFGTSKCCVSAKKWQPDLTCLGGARSTTINQDDRRPCRCACRCQRAVQPGEANLSMGFEVDHDQPGQCLAVVSSLGGCPSTGRQANCAGADQSTNARRVRSNHALSFSQVYTELVAMFFKQTQQLISV